MAKPFVCALEGHSDALTALAVPRRGVLVQCVSGGADGEVRAWDLAARQCVWSSGAAHVGSVKGLTLTRDGTDVLSCGERQNKTVAPRSRAVNGTADPNHLKRSQTPARDLDLVHYTKRRRRVLGAEDRGRVLHGRRRRFGGALGCPRSQPLRTWTWGSDSVFKARWNPAEPSLLASTSRDRAATLFDSRAPTPLRKVILRSMQSIGLEPARADVLCGGWRGSLLLYV